MTTRPDTPSVRSASAPAQGISITESPNELTTDIDVAPPAEIVRLLRASDAQIYNGYRGFPALCDDPIIERIVQASGWAQPLMGREDATIVLSGAGTSGRLAMFAARTFNRFLAGRGRVPNFRHLIAGTDLALIKAQEKAEDDPHQAWKDLRPVIQGKRAVLYVGVTCAFAAPYVASQLWHLSRRPRTGCVLIGFNPADRARRLEIENWDRTFADVVGEIGPKRNCLILNPIVGPEPITGSTRMKGGSATKLLLETIFGLAAHTAGLVRHHRAPDSPEDFVRACLRGYEAARLAVYEESHDLSELVSLGGEGLRRGGHIHYVGTGSRGILGIVDASECPPTFGADFDDVRGFVVGGWRTMLGGGRDLSFAGPWYRISLADFLREKLPALTHRDLVVGLPAGRWDPPLIDALRRSRRAGARVAAVQIAMREDPPVPLDVRVRVRRVPPSFVPGAPVFAEYATKLVLNALTTGAHTLAGKVYQNRMVDLRISNHKLYDRAIGILQAILGVSAGTAKRCLLRSLYGLDRLTPEIIHAKPSRHVEAATGRAKVVPRALILAGSRATCTQADRMLRQEPVVRAAIERLRNSSNQR